MTDRRTALLHCLDRALSSISAHAEIDSAHARQVSGASCAATHIENAALLSSAPSPLAHQPIRTIHSLSCTGGTLFAKCIASMPNAVVLNEIDLHSPLGFPRRGRVRFSPTDVIALLRQSGAKLEPDLINELFLSNLDVLYRAFWRKGQQLVLRDHAHSHFLYGGNDNEAPTLAENVQSTFPVLSVLTVRDPADSWSAMVRQGWQTHFAPATFDEYCRRYLVFLRRYESVRVFKYERFVADPETVMHEICDVLALSYFPDFQNVFSVFRFSGDSGRGGTKVTAHPRREPSDALRTAARSSVHYRHLIERLEYPPIC